MSMSIDFSKAPEGATHYCVDVGGVVIWCRRGRTGQVLLRLPIGGWAVTNMSLDEVHVRSIPGGYQSASVGDAPPAIDFGSAPKGATHYMPVTGGVLWYRGVAGATAHWRDGKWGASYLSLDTPLMLQIPNAELPVGSKHDTGKPLMGTVPPNALLAVAQVLTFGAQKYGRDNWRQVSNAETRYLDAALRHINAYQRGEAVDPESGESHLAHAVCSLMFMLELREGE